MKKLILIFFLHFLSAHLFAQKPNILFISIHDLKPMLGCFGDTVIKTPNIDAIANKGVSFLNTSCQQALCNPSRTSLLTGKYPDETKVYNLKTKN